jgi:hypothetical protein
LEAWHASVSFPHLTELYFAFNMVNEESALAPSITQNPNLTFLVITGNPFATVLPEPSELEDLLSERKNGQLINESLNPPQYMRGARMRTAPADGGNQSLFTNMMNYGQSKGLVQVQEPNMYKGDDPYVLGKPLAIEFQQDAFETDEAIDQEDIRATEAEINGEPIIKDVTDEPQGFFITENMTGHHAEPQNEAPERSQPVSEEPAVPQESFGEYKMQLFKRSAR